MDLKLIENKVRDLAPIIDAETINEKGFTMHSLDDYQTIEDSFVRFRTMVADATEIYNHARQIAAVSDTGLSSSINRMGEPFRKGYFTLAIVGKMNAGKSTFINALLGDHNLLPTGHFQTTCTLTTILHSDQKKLHIIYGDMHEENKTESIEAELRRLVAIPEEYKDLPVNNVNRLILYGKSEEEICSPAMVKEMEGLVKHTVDTDLLRNYIEAHPKESIPRAVVIEWPLKEAFRGWRIVDTPGVDAIGGIEDDTKQFLCGCDEDGNHNIDAIVFAQKAQGSIEERTLNEFISDTINSLTEEAKKRAFLVLTHATSPDFLVHKEDVMERARKLFVDYSEIGINEDRLIFVDSLAELMRQDYLLDFKTLIKKSAGMPQNWDEKEWDAARNLIMQVKGMLEVDDEIEFNNENTRRKFTQLSNFVKLRELLDNFVQQEKSVAFEKIISTIIQDIESCISIKEKDIKILQNNLGSSPEAFIANLEMEKEKLDDFQLKTNMLFKTMRDSYSQQEVDGQFQEEVSEDLTLETFKSLSSMVSMRRKADEFGSKAVAIEKRITESIKNEAQNLIGQTLVSMNVVLPAIDFDQIQHQAKKDSTSYTTETYRVAKKQSFGSGIARFFGGFFGTDWGWETDTRTVEHHDKEKEKAQLASTIFKTLQTNLENYRKNIQKELRSILEMIDKEVKASIEKRKSDYDQLAKGTNIVEKINTRQQEIELLRMALQLLAIYHLPTPNTL